MNESTQITPATTMPRIGDAAPAFDAITTQGNLSFPADYAGRWVILFSHPADFTPVCTSEFITFASMQDEFKAYTTELVGLSIDGLYSHITWLRTIKEKITFRGFRDAEGTFPLIEDITMEVATKYGMIMPGEDSTRSSARCSSSTRPELFARSSTIGSASAGTSTNCSGSSRHCRLRTPSASLHRRLAARRTSHRPHRRILRNGQ